jgi:pimeloyl-ACP methyl ester carboxylesterase
MEPFAHPVFGELWLASMFKPLFRILMYRFGLENNDAMSTEEIDAYVDLLKREDGGTAFLKIMRGFERTREKRDLYVSTIQESEYPKKVIWGKYDPALSLERYGEEAREVTGVDSIVELSGRHFLQEEQYDRIAEEIRGLAD